MIRSRSVVQFLIPFLVCMAPVSGAVARAETPGEDASSLARRYAPILWLAPDEPAYPMRPFPFAFDGIDNDEDGCYDLDDADEIDALRPPRGRPARDMRKELEHVLANLRDLRAAARTAERDPAASVRSRATELQMIVSSKAECRPQSGRPLKDFKLCEDVSGNLECGPGAALFYHYRNEVTARDVHASKLKPENVSAIQYWLYYPWDDEHLHDGEHVSVFFSEKRHGERIENRVEAVVGAGHLASTANNVLAHIDGKPYPARIPDHMPILVEMGKHSSAPDLNCNGTFDLGQDSNYLPTGPWGTRDINYAVGKSQWDKYETHYSFDRTQGEMLVESQAKRNDHVVSCPEHSLGGALLREIVFPGEEAPGSERPVAQVFVTPGEDVSKDRHASMRYRLISAARLENVLTAPDADLGSRLFSAQADLFPPFRMPWQTPADVRFDPVFAHRVVELRSAPANTKARPDVWRHSDFGKYGNDFKAGLFRTLSWGPSYTVENGNARWGGFVRFAPTAWDSSVELHLWADRLFPAGEESVADANAALEGHAKGRPLEAALLYNAFSTSYRGLYGGLSFRSSDLRYARQYVVPRGAPAGSGTDTVVRTRQPRNLFIEAGYSFALPLLEHIPRLREGLRQKLAKRPLQIRIGVAGPLGWEAADRNEQEKAGTALRADKWQQAVELRVTLQLRVSNIGRHVGGHPLEPAGR